MANSNPKFRVGQIVRYKRRAGLYTRKARHGGTVLEIVKAYELKEENKRYYPNGACIGEATTIKELSNGKVTGYAYKVKSVQPEGYASDYSYFIESNLNLSTKKQIIESYNVGGNYFTV